jgi:hypothetical protein
MQHNIKKLRLNQNTSLEQRVSLETYSRGRKVEPGSCIALACCGSPKPLISKRCMRTILSTLLHPYATVV